MNHLNEHIVKNHTHWILCNLKALLVLFPCLIATTILCYNWKRNNSRNYLVTESNNNKKHHNFNEDERNRVICKMCFRTHAQIKLLKKKKTPENSWTHIKHYRKCNKCENIARTNMDPFERKEAKCESWTFGQNGFGV